MLSESELLANAEAYAQRNGRNILRKARLGGGTDGSVWRSDKPSAIKALRDAVVFQNELESYLRLKDADIHRLSGFDIPRLVGWDAALWVIEMSIVQPRYLLDFGKVYFDRPPTDVYDSQQMKAAEVAAQTMFGPQWPTVAQLLYELQEKVGIWYVDPKPANINFGDFDDPDWDKEPGIDYSDYDDPRAQDS